MHNFGNCIRMNYMAISCIDQIEIFSYHVDNSIEIIMKNKEYFAEKINKQISNTN